MLNDVDADGEPDEQRPEVEGDYGNLKIKIPPMARSVFGDNLPGLRRSTRTRKSSDSFAQPSGSEYSAQTTSPSDVGSDRSKRRRKQDVVLVDDDFEPKPIEEVEYTTSHGRLTKKKLNYFESDDDGLNLFKEDEEVELESRNRSTRSNGRRGGQAIVSDEEDGEAKVKRYPTRNQVKKSSESMSPLENIENDGPRRITRSSSRRITRKSQRQLEDEDGYEAPADADADAHGSSDDEMDAAHTTPSPEPEEEAGPKTYSFRRRTKQINYAIPPPIEEMARPPPKAAHRPNKGKARGPGWSANGTELSRYMGMPGPADDSDSDYPTRTPRKPFTAGAGGGLFAAGGGGLFPTDLAAAAGTPSNLGKVSDSALADADPLGVNTNVTFDEVGGLDDHINSLKEMTLLPLLYPEVFQRFSLTPPRGVLFHGPPGTGKTLLARALAASCRANGRGISFFMRKGADCLSKWVGEAERQLRLLFEEARNQQPSIIFFDEIDGLAPVRSSKQDQIHASIVSTLLALMDGMDGRGQVIVIGATNRPDAVDPALRRPGRFDREFYFPLPNFEARAKILSIITRKWDGWHDDKAHEAIQRLAKITKGYGGADLRALCTEAALNAVQRRYPQIYKSNERLLLKPETIGVQARDFMISVKKLVPSSARSTSSTAAPLPSQLAPLLEETMEHVKTVLDRALPLGKKRTALEEAEYEDEGDEGALDREVMMQKMETLRVYRPRVVLHGSPGMGQAYIGAAALHHLEGYHIQTLDLGSLMGDSTRTVESGIVQLFVEAKRHQPSIIYIPSLLGWCAAVTETARTTVKAMLDTLSPSDPILLLAVVDGPFSALPRDVRSWFGFTRETRVAFTNPDSEKRRKFFDELLIDIRREPTQFPDGVKRRKRVLEELPVAPPLEPRQPTAAELAVQEEADQKVLTLLKYRLGPILQELKRKFKRFTKRARDEYNLYPPGHWDPFVMGQVVQDNVQTNVNGVIVQENGIINIDSQGGDQSNGQVNGINHAPQVPQEPQEPQLYEVDLESMQMDLYKGKYLTPDEFLEEVGKMVFNAEVRANEDRDRLYRAQAMFTATQVSVQEFDPQFRLECERMAARERKRRDQRRAEKKNKAAENGANNNGSGQENGAPVRRSARNNGQEPELAITDPLLLERRLKRQRSQDANTDSHESGEDNVDDRLAKRPRGDVVMQDDTDRDPLDVVGPTSSQARPTTVRFAPVEGSETPSRRFPGDGAISQQVLTPVLEVDSEPRPTTGFDPNLLNPMPTFDPPLPSLQSYMMSSMTEENASPLIPGQENLAPQNFFSLMPQPVGSEALSVPVAQFSAPPISPPRSPRHSPAPGIAARPEPDQGTSETLPVAMEVERPRSPTPPLPPPFHVDEDLLLDLESRFVNRTEKLNVEQLEQLRATSLNCIWRHRQEWDRDACIRELFGVIEEFVEEASLDIDDDDGQF